MNNKKGTIVINTFQKNLDESNGKLSKTWVDMSKEFYNRSMKSWLQDNGIEIYSKYYKGKSVVAERFIRILKNNIYKYVTSISKNVYIDKLDDIGNTVMNITIQSKWSLLMQSQVCILTLM